MTRGRLPVLLPALALLALTSACGGSSGDSTASGGGGASGGASAPADNRAPKAGGSLTVALAEDPDALDPTLARTLVGREVFVSMCEKLYDVDASLALVPQLAAALPQVSADGKTVTIKLRSGVTFNDGTKMDAASVKTSLDRDRTLQGSARTGDLKAVTNVTVVDPGTVKLTLSSPYAPLTAQLADRAGMIMSPAALSKLGDKFGSSPVCVGPFSFVSRTPGNEIKLKKSTYYYGKDKVQLDDLTYRIITDANVRLANVKSGDVQVAERLAATDVAKLQGDTSVKLLSQDSLGYQGISINIGNTKGVGNPVGKVSTPLGTSADLRKAFEMSIDRDVINKVVFAGKYKTICGPLPEASPYHAADAACTAHDVKGAKDLVAKAGVQTPVPVELIVAPSPESLRLGQVVQSEAKEAGFDVKVKPVEFASSLDQTDAGKFDTFAIGWSGRIDPDGNIYNFLHTGAPLNISGLADPSIDALLEQARLVTDQGKRTDLYKQALAKAAEQRSIIYVYQPVNYLATGKDVVGIKYYADGLPRLDAAGLAG
jgi:peptide/nickel transport system substrate-binding protein